jgi:hypothetical protein
MKVQATPAQMAANQGVSPEVKETDQPRRGRNALPDSAKKVPAKFLGGPEPKTNNSDPLRPVLADWMTKPENPYFSKSMTNRIWAQLMGRGLVNPVDDMHDGNPASHPELLADLAEQFGAGNNFDVKYLIRAICNSKTYQRSGKPTADQTEYQAGIPQALRLMNGPQLTNGQAALALLKGKTPEQAVEHLYLATMSRRPTTKERETIDRLLKKDEPGKVYSDLLWALLNSSEFTLNK